MDVAVIPTIIYSSMLGITVFALFEVLHQPRQRQTVYLGLLQGLLLIHILGELFIYSGAYRFAPQLAGAQFPIRMLLGPALYFYAFASMSPAKALPAKSYILALLGPLLVILGMLPFVLGISAQDKLALANPATRDPELFKIALYTCLFAMVCFILFTGAYLLAAFRLQQKHRAQLMQRFADIEQRSMDWFRILLLLWGAVWLLFALDYGLSFMGVKWFGAGIILPIFEALVLMVFSHFALRQPVLAESDKAAPELNKTRAANLPERKMAQISAKLKTAMSQQQLFLDEELSLNRLSDAIGESENHISETLSQGLTTNFFQFVNGYRIEFAMAQLRDTDSNVTQIVFDAGFNSKSTFNTAFKKVTGLTPTAYRKAQALL